MHLHTAVEEITIERLLGKFNKKTKKLEKFTGAKFLKQGDQGVCRFRLSNVTSMDTADDFPAMGRFTLRDEGKTIAMGVIKKILE
jgi:peptide chain release factor subunit 3